MKKTVFLAFAIFSLLGALSFAQRSRTPEQSLRILARANNAFTKGDYSTALSICEQARVARHNEVSRSCDIMEYVLNTPEVKKHGPFISDLIPILEQREEYDALDIINSELSKHGADFFGNSLPKLYEYLKSLNAYPESDFLLSKIYRLEGEYDLAMEFLEKARAHSDVLDIPAQKYDILYEMVDLAKVQGKEDIYEKALKLIVADDGLYKNETMKRAMLQTVKLKRKGVDPAEYFMHFYRSNALNSMKAYFELGDLCEKRGESKESFLMTAFGVIVGFTHTIEILDDRLGTVLFDENERFSLEPFFEECGRNEDILAWTQKSGLWRGFYNLAVRANKNGWSGFSTTLLEKLENACPDYYWKKAAEEANKSVE